MLIHDKKHFSMGILMAVGFWVLFFVIMMPIFGKGMNGLEFADDIFNRLSKGSAYYIPKVMKANEAFVGKQFSVSIKYDKPEEAQRVINVLTVGGATVTPQGNELKVEGDVGKMLAVVGRDADLMYKNDGEKVKATYNADETQVMKDWWGALKKIDKALQLKSEFPNAKMIGEVVSRVIEPAHNFYKMEALKVTDKIGTMVVLLAFYVFYTIWWGFALYHLFEGVGLTTKKAKVKKEV